jgi:hypothetical protein
MHITDCTDPRGARGPGRRAAGPHPAQAHATAPETAVVVTTGNDGMILRVARRADPR